MFNRRSFIASSAVIGSGAGLAAASPAGAAANPELGSVLGNPQQIMEALVKMRGSTDGRIGYWWMKGPRFGVVGTKITPLFNNVVSSFHKFVKQPDGSYNVSVVELSYYTDLDSGELVRRWKNPITGQMNDVEYIIFGPVTVNLRPDGITPPKLTPGAELRVKPSVGIVAAHDGDVWLKEDVQATIVPKDPARATYSGNDLATYQARLSDLADPAQKGVPSSMHYQSVTDWRSWMKMGDIKGHLMARAVGRKVWSPDDLPDEFLKIARQLNPKIMNDTVASLEAPPPASSFHR